MAIQFSTMQRLYFEERGEVQNGSIAGVNADQQERCKRLLNHEMEALMDLHPPFAHKEWHLHLQDDIALQSSSLNSATGSKNRPWLYDTGGALKQRDAFRMLDNGTYRRVVTSVSARAARSVYYLDASLSATSTTADSWVAYKTHYALPHDVGLIDAIVHKEGIRSVYLAKSRAEFEAHSTQVQSSSEPRLAGINVFSNGFSDYKYQETGVTATQNSRKLTVADSDYYEIGNVVSLGKYVHTVQGVDTTNNNLWIDRDYTSTTTLTTLTLNPNEYTEYISLWRWPNADNDILLRGYRRPVRMIAATDKSIFPDRLVPTIVIGALLRDALGRRMLSEQWIAYYEKVKEELQTKHENTEVFEDLAYPPGWMNRGYLPRRGSDFDFTSIGL